MEAALKEPVYKVGNIQTGRRELKETAFPPSPAWAWGGGPPGAHAINMVRAPRGGRDGEDTAGVGDR